MKGVHQGKIQLICETLRCLCRKRQGENPSTSSAKMKVIPRFLRSEAEPRRNIENRLNKVVSLEYARPLTSYLICLNMKRKLNDEQVPTPTTPESVQQGDPTFASFGLDARLLQAIAQENFSCPTLVQAKAVPLILDGKDVLGGQ